MRTVLLTGFSLLAAVASHAAAITLNPAGGDFFDDNATVGFSFSTASDINVTALGFFDSNDDGLVGSHSVAIWSTTDTTALVSATVPGGTAGTLNGGFRYVAISPFFLAAGTYVIGADKPTVSSTDVHVGTLVAGNVTTAPGITYLQNRFGFDGTGFIRPDSTFGQQERGYFGPNFEFTDASSAGVPEPGTLALMAGGIAACLFVRRRA